jgi:hypothetical protein
MEVSGQLHAGAALSHGGRPPGTHWIGYQNLPGYCGVDKNISCLCRESNPGLPARTQSLYRLSYRGCPGYVYVLDKNINKIKSNIGIIEACKEICLDENARTTKSKMMYCLQTSRQDTDPLKKVQIFENDSNKSKLNSWRKREQIKFEICLH